MADVGSLAAARIARQKRVPFVFTMAPDPHALIDEMERAGELNRRTFGSADAEAAFWFRARLVRHLANAATRVVLFPRPELEARLRDLVGIDIAADRSRYHVVPEGIDVASADRARREVRMGGGGRAATDLREAIRSRGPERTGLPLVLSVGRLVDVKGMARLVEAFAADPQLRHRANLLIVGGNLTEPTDDERRELTRIELTKAADPGLADAVILLGHQPHDDVLHLMAIAEAGDGPWVGKGGAYTCASRKEEFGLAIVEALAVGLPVVAPVLGGPASYLEDGVTGRLVDTMDPRALATGIRDALDLAGAPGRAQRARDLVASGFTIGAMADARVPIDQAAQPAAQAVAA